MRSAPRDGLIFGPAAEAAQLEGSKIFAKNFFVQSGIPTAAYAIAEDPAEARRALDRFGFPVVLKADGLAAGKGVIIAHDRAEAEAALGVAQRAGWWSRSSSRAKRSASSPSGRPRRRPARAHAGPQGGLRRRHRPQHRRHGRVLRFAHPHAKPNRAR